MSGRPPTGNDNVPHTGYFLSLQGSSSSQPSSLPSMSGLSDPGTPHTLLVQPPMTPIARAGTDTPQATTRYLGQTRLASPLDTGTDIPPFQRHQRSTESRQLQYGPALGVAQQRQGATAMSPTMFPPHMAPAHVQGPGYMLPPHQVMGQMQQHDPASHVRDLSGIHPPPHQHAAHPAQLGVAAPQFIPAPAQAQAMQRVPPQVQDIQCVWIPPLPAEQFERFYTLFCEQNGVAPPDPALLQHHGHPFTLHALHFEVFSIAPYDQIKGNDDVWAIIGGRLGFIRFPATESLPARAGPAVVEQLRDVYAQFLHRFELLYVRRFLETRRHQARQQQIRQRQQMQLQQMQQMHMQQAHMQVPVQLSLQGMPHDSPVLQHPIPMRPAQMDQAHMLPGDVPGSTAGTLVPIAYGQQAYFPATPVPPDLAEALHAIAEANVVLQNLAREIDEDLRRMCALLVEDFRITLMDSETHIVPEGELQEHCRLLGAAEALVQHVQRAFGTAVRFIEPDDIRKTISLIMRVAHQRYLLTQDPPCYSIALASMPIFLESLQLRTLFLDATVAAAITPNVLAHMAPFELDAETSFARPGQDGVPIPPQPGAGLARPVTPSQFDALLTMANEDAEDVKPIIKAEDDIE